MPLSLSEQVEEAKEHLRVLKHANPRIFNEYSRLLAAKRGLEEAQKELDRAQRAWDALGN